MKKIADHTFVICAYKESEYLDECVNSLINQYLQSSIIITTSTPNDYIQGIAQKYGLPVLVNRGETGITQDWNFALSQVNTKYATIAHQDDYYEPDYLASILDTMEKKKHSLIGFTDYYEIRNGENVDNNTFLKIKKIMLLPLRITAFSSWRFARRLCLSFGDPIGCPSVTFNLVNVKRPIFSHGFRSCEDWEAWEKISRETGDFVYVPITLMGHRIHEDSETSAIIRDNARNAENYEMFCKFWPKWIARMLTRLYSGSEKYNDI